MPTIPALVHVPAPYSFKYSIDHRRLSMMIRTAALLALPLLHLIEATAAALPLSSHPSSPPTFDHDDAVMAIYHNIHLMEEHARDNGDALPRILLDVTRNRLAQHLRTSGMAGTASKAGAAAGSAAAAAAADGVERFDASAVAGSVLESELSIRSGEALRANTRGATRTCSGLCTCLASEFLFGATGGVLPYATNAQADDKQYPRVFKYSSVEGTTPLWYRRRERKWQWTPSDPADGWGPDWALDSGWTSCDAPDPTDVNGGVWGMMQSGGLAEVAGPNKLLIATLGNIQPGDNGGRVPEGSDAKRADAKYDLSLCATRNSLSDLDKCQCRGDACVKVRRE